MTVTTGKGSVFHRKLLSTLTPASIELGLDIAANSLVLAVLQIGEMVPTSW
jgi:hypothetical protein